MKRNNYLYCTAALLLVILAAACTRDDDFTGPPVTAATPLTITVTDGAYAPAETPDGSTPATRAVERGYGTEFTTGDKIGLYAVEISKNGDRKLLHENLCLTHDGTDWTLPAAAELTHRPPEGGEIIYLAYYPYQDDRKSKFDISASDPGTKKVTTETQYFFQDLIVNWQPATDQSTYEKYTASDLMVAKGVVTKRKDDTDGSVLKFTMEHQMALSVIRVPTTKYTYTETIIGIGTTKKSYRLYSGLDAANTWKENSYTVRFLTNPRRGIRSEINGTYCTDALKKCKFTVQIDLDSSAIGTYYTFNIDKGTETETTRSLQAGDFYMKDGGIVPKENVSSPTMPTEVRADCLGVVFWAGEVEDSDDTPRHWTLRDRLLMHDHPECTHGIVVALKDATDDEKKVWSSTSKGATYTWLNSYSATGQEAEKELLLQGSNYGYTMSRRLQWYQDYGKESTEACDAIETFAKANPTPAGCSGWYFPGYNEMIVMALGTLNVNDNKGMTTTLNLQFDKAGGKRFKTDDYYWSSTDTDFYPKDAYCIRFKDNKRSADNKSDGHYVRAVLAF